MGSLYEASDRFANVTTWFLIAERSLEAAATQVETTASP